jgi:tetratricopeptide (TPR) repeat protein
MIFVVFLQVLGQLNHITQTDDEIRLLLEEQIDFMKKSCRSYDLGDHSEAKRLAVALRILLYDPGNNSQSQSILRQLNKKAILFHNTAYDHNPEGIISQFRLLSLGILHPEYIAPLDNFRSDVKRKKLTFQEWWDWVIFEDRKKRTITRGRLILFLANQDGGAHVDSKLNDTYFDLTRKNSIGLMVEKNGGFVDMPGPHLYSIRQISHEVLKTLKDEFPEYFMDNTVYGLDASKWHYSNDTRLGIHFYRRGLIDDAIFELRKALSFNNGDYKARYYLGRSYAIKALYDEAIREFGDAIKIKPDNSILLNSLGYAHFLKGDYPKAIDLYQEAIKMPQQFDGIHANLAEALFKNGDVLRSIKGFETLIRLFPGVARGYFKYGNTLFAAGFIHHSIGMYKKAVDLEYDSADISYKLGLAYGFIGSFDDAVKAFTMALEKDPERAETQQMLLTILRMRIK